MILLCVVYCIYEEGELAMIVLYIVILKMEN